MVRSPKTSSMINLLWAKDPKRTPSLDIKIFASATWRFWTSIQRSGRILQQTATAGAACSRRCWRQVRRRSWSWTWQKEESQADGTQTRQTPPPPPLTSNYVCTLCSRDYHSRIGLTRHRQCCSSHNTTTSSAAVSMVDIDRRRLLRDTLKTKQKRLRAQWNRSLFLLEFFLCLNWLVHIIS